LLQIRAVDACRAYPDAHLSARRLGRWTLDELEDFGSAESRNDDRSH
jgi:hypothetical protein